VPSQVPQSLRTARPGEKALKLAEVLALPDSKSFYRQLVSHWKDSTQVVMGADRPDTPFEKAAGSLNTGTFEEWMMAIDGQTYLPDDILVKVDRAAMANSLETRVPFLDHRVVELAWRLPLHMKIRNGHGKSILRSVLHKYVPKELIDRPKMGFGVPIDSWLRGPLKAWAEELLDESRLKREGYFNPAPIRAAWRAHSSGDRNLQYNLWNVLMFQAWLEADTGDA